MDLRPQPYIMLVFQHEKPQIDFTEHKLLFLDSTGRPKLVRKGGFVEDLFGVGGGAGQPGPKGDQGERGIQGFTGNVGGQGVPGEPGPQGDPGICDPYCFLSGSGPPDSEGDGDEGSFYIDTSTYEIYGPATWGSGVLLWGSPVSLVGPPGPAGAIFTKAGPLVDADFVTPIDGCHGFDTLNSKHMVRSGGVWLSSPVYT